MNDPHVAQLSYRIIESDDFAFENAPALHFATAEFEGVLEANVLRLTPKAHFAAEADAVEVAAPFIAGWMIHAELRLGRPDFQLRYDGAQVVDRAPSPGHHSLHVSNHAKASVTAHLKVLRHQYPEPPTRFSVTPEVQVIWDRFCAYVAGKEPLLSMAYFCLTLLERGNRKAAAGHFGVELAVLSKLGELTSERGDGATARKMTPNTKPLSGAERTWLETAIKALCIHLAGAGSGQSLSMANLPPLP